MSIVKRKSKVYHKESGSEYENVDDSPQEAEIDIRLARLRSAYSSTLRGKSTPRLRRKKSTKSAKDLKSKAKSKSKVQIPKESKKEDDDFDENRPCPIFTLPQALRVKIFNYLPTQERVKVQLVCRLFRFEIRVRCGVAGYVNDKTTWGISFFRDIICDTVAVGKFLQPKLTPVQLILRSKLVRHLLFCGPISIQYMDAFIARCRSITRLTVQCQVQERSPVPNNSAMRRAYKTWRRLENIRRIPYRLDDCKFLEISPQEKFSGQTIQWTLELCRFTSLVKVAVKVTSFLRMDEVRRIHTAMLDFIGKHPQLLDCVINSKVCKDDRNLPMDQKLTSLRPDKEILQNSKNCQLRQLSLTEEIVDFNTWGCFLAEQRNLEVLQVLHRTNYSVLLPTLLLNLNLTKLALHVVLQYETKAVGVRNMFLDLTTFTYCSGLKEIFISVAGPFDPGCTDITNFKKLPPSLEVIALRNVTFHSRDFCNLSLLPNIKSIGALVLTGTGIKSHNLSLKALKTMTKIRTLEELLLQGFTLPVSAVQDVFTLARDTDSLTKGQPNTIYIRNQEDISSNRWVLGGILKQFRFKIFEDRLFEA